MAVVIESLSVAQTTLELGSNVEKTDLKNILICEVILSLSPFKLRNEDSKEKAKIKSLAVHYG